MAQEIELETDKLQKKRASQFMQLAMEEKEMRN